MERYAHQSEQNQDYAKFVRPIKMETIWEIPFVRLDQLLLWSRGILPSGTVEEFRRAIVDLWVRMLNFWRFCSISTWNEYTESGQPK